MLYITVPGREFYNEATNEFITVKDQTLQLEHSLVSLSKWESKWCKPFLTKKEKSYEEIVDYIRCMTLTQNVNPLVYQCLTTDNIDQINKYIESPMTATRFRPTEDRASDRDPVTAEYIYYLMITFNIPFECQKWHLNRLQALIEVCNRKNGTKKPMSKSELAKRNTELNNLRRKQLGTRG